MSDNTELTMMVGRKSISDCKKIGRNVKLTNKITGGYVAIRTHQSILTPSFYSATIYVYVSTNWTLARL